MRSSRRDFLKSAVGASALVSFGPAVPGFLASAANAASGQRSSRDTVLVVLQLTGGNDGLNTVVPYENDAYGRNRTTLRLTGRDVHRIAPGLGLHPEMNALARLFSDGRLSIVQGTGYPELIRNHQPAMRNWQTARPTEPHCQSGWAGRAVDQLAEPGGTLVPGCFVGPIDRPLALNAERAVVPAVASADRWTLRRKSAAWADGQVDHLREAAAASRPGADDALLRRVAQGASAAYDGARRVDAVLRQSDSRKDYPPYGLARSLAAIAQLIRAELGVRIFMAELGGGGLGGFDNHASQRDNHAALLRQLSESLAAFVADLSRDRLLDRVVLVTFSEFGRTLAENGRHGTGHGEAAPMLLAGGRLAGGLVGEHPDLDDLNEGAPRYHTDFRRVYATLLDEWLGVESRPVLGEAYKPLKLLQA